MTASGWMLFQIIEVADSRRTFPEKNVCADTQVC